MRRLILLVLMTPLACGGSGDSTASGYRSSGFCGPCMGEVVGNDVVAVDERLGECESRCRDLCDEDEFDEFDPIFGPVGCPDSRECRSRTCTVCDSDLGCNDFSRPDTFQSFRCSAEDTEFCEYNGIGYTRF